MFKLQNDQPTLFSRLQIKHPDHGLVADKKMGLIGIHVRV